MSADYFTVNAELPNAKLQGIKSICPHCKCGLWLWFDELTDDYKKEVQELYNSCPMKAKEE